jgi:hypothetical protein
LTGRKENIPVFLHHWGEGPLPTAQPFRNLAREETEVAGTLDRANVVNIVVLIWTQCDFDAVMEPGAGTY